MDPNNEYNDYSALDAPQHLQHVLEHLFSQKQNAYKFALAKKHFKDVQHQDTFVDATCLFKILTGTNLVTKKHVMHYRTTQGMRHLIKKEYAQSSQRDLRNAKRTLNKTLSDATAAPTTPSPFVQMTSLKTPLHDSSSDDETTAPLEHKETKDNSPGNKASDDTASPLPTKSQPTVEQSPFQSKLTEHAAALEKTMDSAMADLDDPETAIDDNDLNVKLESLFCQTFQRKLDDVYKRLNITEHNLTVANEQYASLQSEHSKFKTKFNELQFKYDQLNRTVSFHN